MREYLKKLPPEIKNLIRRAGRVANENNMRAYLVGGFVRDLILGVKNLDVDIAVEGSGIKFAEELSAALKAKIIRHRRFGTATISLSHNLKIDIATAREECYPEPACLPLVKSGRLKDDLKRRDFSINAMSIGLNGDDFGRLIDFFHGLNDLRSKKIRVLHDSSFIDDPTRILRAVRFEKRYNFRIETHTLKALKKAVALKMLERVQPQRLRDELILSLKEPSGLKQIRRLNELTGFGFINAGLSFSKKNYALLETLEGQINWFRKAYSRRRQLDAWLIYFFGVVDPLSSSEVQSICKRYVFSRGEEKRILSFKKTNHSFIRRLGLKEIKPAQIFSLLEPLSYEVILALKAKYKAPLIQKRIEDFFEIYNGMRLSIRGADLHRLGVMPGPYYRKIFTRVMNAKLNGKIKTEEEEMGLMRRLTKSIRDGD
ncbi:MAG: CCA tRNA nucleotidyltransferase [Candidatus Omnitrophota bacterium]|jgi:tRNA nucleotidyltransferase (CCA-adding enzyme)